MCYFNDHILFNILQYLDLNIHQINELINKEYLSNTICFLFCRKYFPYFDTENNPKKEFKLQYKFLRNHIKNSFQVIHDDKFIKHAKQISDNKFINNFMSREDKILLNTNFRNEILENSIFLYFYNRCLISDMLENFEQILIIISHIINLISGISAMLNHDNFNKWYMYPLFINISIVIIGFVIESIVIVTLMINYEYNCCLIQPINKSVAQKLKTYCGVIILIDYVSIIVITRPIILYYFDDMNKHIRNMAIVGIIELPIWILIFMYYLIMNKIDNKKKSQIYNEYTLHTIEIIVQ